MLLPHPVDLIAILLGIFLAMRKTETRAEEPARHPHVPVEQFERWRKQALSAYTIGTIACFLKVLIDFAVASAIQQWTFPVWLVRSLGVSLDVAWVVAMVLCWVRARRARKFGEQIGVLSIKRAAPDVGDEA